MNKLTPEQRNILIGLGIVLAIGIGIALINTKGNCDIYRGVPLSQVPARCLSQYGQ